MAIKAKLREFTFPVSGETIFVPPVSQGAMAMKLGRKYPKPTPPMEEVDYGGGVKKMEYNYSHPDYKEKVAAWEAFIEERATTAVILKAFSQPLNAAQKKAVKQWMKDNPGLYDDTDTAESIYREEICIEADQDLLELIQFIQTDPTEAGVNAAADGF